MKLKYTLFSNRRLRLSLVVLLFSCAVFAQENIGPKLHTLDEFKDTVVLNQRLNRIRDDLSSMAPASAIDSLNVLLNQSLAAQFARGVVYSHLYKAKVYYLQANSKLFLKTLEHAILYCCATKAGHAFLPLLYNETGWAHVQHDNYVQAIPYLYRSHALAAQTNDYKLQVSVSLNLTAVMLMLNQYEQAEAYLNEAEAVAMKRNMPAERARALLYRSLVALKNGDNTVLSARSLDEAIDISRKNDLREFLLMALNNRGRLYLETGDTAQALSSLLEASRVGDKDSSTVKIAVMASLGEIYLKLGDYGKAEDLLLQAFIRSQSSGYNSDNLININRILSDIYAAKKDYHKALIYKNLYIELKDSIAGRQVKESINHLEMQYHSVKKDKQLAENKLMITVQQSDLARKNMWISGVALSAFLLIALVTYFYRQKQRNVEYKLRSLQQQEEIMAWEATIKGEEKERERVAHELHDGIGGQLFTLNMYLTAAGKEYPPLLESSNYREGIALLKETMKDLRSTAHNMMPELLVDYGLAEATQLYCAKITQARHLQIDFQQYGVMETKGGNFELSLYHIIRELIQNILKHACATRALVQFSCHDHFLNITVEDNGKGLQVDGEHHDGIGMKTIISRVKMMNGHCSFQTSDAGTVVYMEFDLKAKMSLT